MNGWQDRPLSEYKERERRYGEWVASGMGEGDPYDEFAAYVRANSTTGTKREKEVKALRNTLIFLGVWVILAGIAFMYRHGWSISR
jgi:hypothetical protein